MTFTVSAPAERRAKAVSNVNENFETMRNAGYVASPNNIWSQPGITMYAGAPGIPTWRDSGIRADIQVTADGVYVFKPRFAEGRFMHLEVLAKFSTATEYLQHVALHGMPAPAGLPAFSNSWD